MLVKTIGSPLTKIAAKGGFVDQTREETVGDRGRNAIGPVERNLWYAIVFGAWKAERGECERVATMA
jgi:hypothetical protein